MALPGVSPGAAFAVHVVAPLSERWSLREIALKAAPRARGRHRDRSEAGDPQLICS